MIERNGATLVANPAPKQDDRAVRVLAHILRLAKTDGLAKVEKLEIIAMLAENVLFSR